MRFGVGICTFNRADCVSEAVTSVFRQDTAVHRVLVIDNASTDDTLDRLDEVRDPRLEVLSLKENLGGAGGFALASRLLLEDRSLDAIALVDSDCFLDPICLRSISATVERLGGIVGPKVMYGDRPSVVQEAGAEIDWKRGTLVRRHGDYDESLGEGLSGEARVDYIAACALVAERSVFESVGHFNPSFFLYFDDVEWCFRARQAGYSVVCNASARAFHWGGGRRKTSLLGTYYYWRNRLAFFSRARECDGNDCGDLFEEVARAVSTCRALGQARSADVIMQAARDAVEGVMGRTSLSRERFALDAPVDCLGTAEEGEEAILIEHIFEDVETVAEGDPIVKDRYGKLGRVSKIKELLPAFRRERDLVLTEFSVVSGKGGRGRIHSSFFGSV